MSQMTKEDPESRDLGDVFGKVKALADTLTGRGRVNLMKALGGLYGLTVLPGRQSLRSSTQVAQVPVRKAVALRPQEKPRKLKQLRLRIKSLQSDIDKESKVQGKPLEASHPLRVELDRLFREVGGPKAETRSETAQ